LHYRESSLGCSNAAVQGQPQAPWVRKPRQTALTDCHAVTLML